MEGARVLKDFQCGADALALLESRFPRRYKPRKVHLLGNHEYRVIRHENDNPKLEGTLPHPSQYFIDAGWEVYDFLQPVEIHGVYFSHYFCRGPRGRASRTTQRNGQPSALAQAQREKVSCVAGHMQGLDTAILPSGRGRIRSIIAGSFYLHNEGYIPDKNNDYWRGVLMLNDIRDGDFELSEVSIRYLERKYG